MFKSVSMVSLFLLTQTVSAAVLDANSSWEEIQSSQELTITPPRIDFVSKDSSISSSTISVLDVCLSDENTLRTKEKRRIYKRSTSGRVDNKTLAGQDFLYTDRTSTQRRCVANARSCDWVSESIKIPLMYDIKVREVSHRGTGSVRFTKAYTIEQCR